MSQEGPPAPAADTVPVRTTSEEAWSSRSSTSAPSSTSRRRARHPPPDPISVAFVPVRRDVRFVVDDRGAEDPAIEGADGDQQRASLEPEVPLEPGPHSLTVVLTTPEGEVSTSTALYSVEG